MEVSTEMIMGVAGAIITLGTAYLTIRQVIRARKKDEAAEKAEILQEAKEYAESVKKDLEVKINDLDTKLEHLKEIYSGEIKNLGQKIEDLRSELRNQHGQMVQLLTKLINNSKD